MSAGHVSGTSGTERAAASAVLGAAAALKLAAVFHHRINSDEPQHLHVVWAWTQGLLPYRDVFDNHPPLFHALMAPAFGVVGERADAIVLMRLAVLPLYAASVALTYLLGKRLVSARCGVWAAAGVAIHYDFLLTSTEFRTDDLWTALWLAALVVAVGRPPAAGRTLAASALLGAALCVSQKTVLLIATLLVAAVLTAAVSPGRRRLVSPGRGARHAVAAAAGFAIVPAIVAVFFAANGAGRAMLACTVSDNVLPGLGAWARPWRLALLPVGLAVVGAAAARALRASPEDPARARRVLVALVAAGYVLLLECAWPLVTGQDYLPLWPLAAVIVAQAFLAWDARPERGRRAPALAAAGLMVVEIAVVVGKGPLWRDRTADATALVADALRLTDRGQPVMDAKGETVFRPRPFYPVLETITIERLRRGLLPDTIPEALVRRRCYVAVADTPRFPDRGRAFLDANYLPVGRLRVAGRRLAIPTAPGAPVAFEVAVPGPYAIVAASGDVRGTLDGTPYAGPRELAAGRHAFAAAAPSGALAVLWAQAAARGFSPFGAPGGGR